MLVSKQDILQFIPQRAPIVMVDELLAHSESTSTSQFTIAPDNIFAEDGNFTAPGLVENIAQTAALRSGYAGWLMAQTAGGEKQIAQVGFIGALKDLAIHALPKVNSTITTTVEVTATVMNASVIIGRVMQGEQLLAQCEMKIFLADAPAA